LQVHIDQEDSDGNSKLVNDIAFSNEVRIAFFCTRCQKTVGVFPEVLLPTWMEMAHCLFKEYLIRHFDHSNPRQCAAICDHRSMGLKTAIEDDLSVDFDNSLQRFTLCSGHLSLYISQALWTLKESAATWRKWIVPGATKLKHGRVVSKVTRQERFHQLSTAIGAISEAKLTDFPTKNFNQGRSAKQQHVNWMILSFKAK